MPCIFLADGLFPDIAGAMLNKKRGVFFLHFHVRFSKSITK